MILQTPVLLVWFWQELLLNILAMKSTDKKPDNTIKNPNEWKTGDDPMTGAQQSYLETLASEAGEPIPGEDLTKADASKKIDELRHKTGLDE